MFNKGLVCVKTYHPETLLPGALPLCFTPVSVKAAKGGAKASAAKASWAGGLSDASDSD